MNSQKFGPGTVSLVPSQYVYVDCVSGSNDNYSGQYDWARNLTGTNQLVVAAGSNFGYVGYHGRDSFYGDRLHTVTQFFIAFETSQLVGTISSATLKLYLADDQSVETDFTVEARLYDWGSTVENGDYVIGNNLGNYTLLANLSTSGIGAINSLKNMTNSGTNLVNNINRSGQTKILFNSDRVRTQSTMPYPGTVSLQREYVRFTPSNCRLEVVLT